jgi:hypothetical protein
MLRIELSFYGLGIRAVMYVYKDGWMGERNARDVPV